MSHAITHRTDLDDADLVPTVVLYDVMREAANRLRGRLSHLQDNRPQDGTELLQARIDVTRRADAVDARNRVEIAAADRAFREELAQLPAA